jgi:hypothetical protein
MIPARAFKPSARCSSNVGMDLKPKALLWSLFIIFVSLKCQDTRGLHWQNRRTI